MVSQRYDDCVISSKLSVTAAPCSGGGVGLLGHYDMSTVQQQRNVVRNGRQQELSALALDRLQRVEVVPPSRRQVRYGVALILSKNK